MTRKKPDVHTECVHYVSRSEHFLGAMSPPIFQNSITIYPSYAVFSKRLNEKASEGIYGSADNPTVQVAEQLIAKIENGERAICYGSGMGAITSSVLACAKAGDHIVSIKNVYSPSYVLFTSYLPRFNIDVSFVSGVSVEEVARAIRRNTRIIFLESPTSLTFQLQNLSEIAVLAKKHGIFTMIDNSWATPVFQKPLDLGIDLVIYSGSKYLAGHSDVVAGVIVGKKDFTEGIFRVELSALLGSVLHPFDGWLLVRGMRTLALRMQRHFDNAMKVAAFLESHPKVVKVNYPMNPSHPQHGLAKEQMSGGSGLLSFELHTGDPMQIERFVNSLKYFYLGLGWGGGESLVLPMSALRDQEKKIFREIGVSLSLIRLSVGLEDIEDLIADLNQALLKV